MSTYQDLGAMPVRSARAGRGATARAKVIAFETVQILSASKGRAVRLCDDGQCCGKPRRDRRAHFEVLLRCIFRIAGRRPPAAAAAIDRAVQGH